MRRHRSYYYDKGVNGSNRVYILLLILIGIFTAVFFIGGYRRVNGNIDEYGNEINETTEGTSTEATTEVTTVGEVNSEVEAVAEKFYENSVFVGDSIMAGFAGYAASSEAPMFLKKITFLASVSYGVGDALKGNVSGVVHPMYKGVSQPVTTSISQIKPKRIFINLGINELNGVSAERVGKKYGQLIEKIKEASPNSRIYVISLTYIVNGKEKEHFTNAGIKVYNKYLESHCKEWGATYLDLASKMTKDGNSLPAEYSSDGYVHHNKAGYAVWVQFLRDTAVKYANQ